VVKTRQPVHFTGTASEVQADHVPASAAQMRSHAKHVFLSRISLKTVTDNGEFVSVFSLPMKMPVNIDEIAISCFKSLSLRMRLRWFPEKSGVKRLYMSNLKPAFPENYNEDLK